MAPTARPPTRLPTPMAASIDRVALRIGDEPPVEGIARVDDRERERRPDGELCDDADQRVLEERGSAPQEVPAVAQLPDERSDRSRDRGPASRTTGGMTMPAEEHGADQVASPRRRERERQLGSQEGHEQAGQRVAQRCPPSSRRSRSRRWRASGRRGGRCAGTTAALAGRKKRLTAVMAKARG